MWAHVGFAVLLILLAAGLIADQLRRRRREAAGTGELERDYLRRRFRRRLAANLLIAGVGVAVLGGFWISSPSAMACYWGGVLVLVFWLVCLALADAASTRSFFRTVRRRQLDELDELRRQLKRARRARNNGDPRDE